MSYSKFNQALMFAGLVALGATAALQGCSSDSTQAAPSGGSGGKVSGGGSSGKAGATNRAGAESGGDAGATPSGGTGNVGGDSGASGEGGAAGEPNPGCTDPLICGEGTCDDSYDNTTLGLKNGKLPALP